MAAGIALVKFLENDMWSVAREDLSELVVLSATVEAVLQKLKRNGLVSQPLTSFLSHSRRKRTTFKVIDNFSELIRFRAGEVAT